jgi:hypothetical protein
MASAMIAAMAETNSASDHSLLWGYPVDFWDRIGIWALIVGAIIGVVALLLTAASAYILYRVADLTQFELVSETKKSAEFIAGLNNQTEKLKADNLALQTVMLPRYIGLVGLDGPAPAQDWFAGLEAFANTRAEIQFAPDSESQNLAKQIFTMLQLKGWHPQLIDEKRSNSLNIIPGVSVSYPIGKPWTAEEPNQPWFGWSKAAEALADSLTRAGLGWGGRPVSRHGFTNERPPIPGMVAYFDPPLAGVYVQVGERTIALTLQWIRQGRPDALGNTEAAASPK